MDVSKEQGVSACVSLPLTPVLCKAKRVTVRGIDVPVSSSCYDPEARGHDEPRGGKREAMVASRQEP